MPDKEGSFVPLGWFKVINILEAFCRDEIVTTVAFVCLSVCLLKDICNCHNILL